MTKLPWFLSLFFALVALWSWTRSSESMKNTVGNTNASDSINPRAEKMSLSKSKDGLLDRKKTKSMDDSEQQKITKILKDPAIQKHIEAEVEKRVQTEANRLAKQEVDDLKREQRDEKISKTNAYMDGLESFFMNTINVYAEEFEIEQPVANELGDIIEHGFQKQRDLYDQLMNEQLTEEEYKTQAGEAKQEDKEAIESLLGEEGAEDFNTILSEEGRKARESGK